MKTRVNKKKKLQFDSNKDERKHLLIPVSPSVQACYAKPPNFGVLKTCYQLRHGVKLYFSSNLLFYPKSYAPL